MEGKRKESEPSTDGALVLKKQKVDEAPESTQKQLIANIPTDAAKALMVIIKEDSHLIVL